MKVTVVTNALKANIVEPTKKTFSFFNRKIQQFSRKIFSALQSLYKKTPKKTIKATVIPQQDTPINFPLNPQKISFSTHVKKVIVDVPKNPNTKEFQDYTIQDKDKENCNKYKLTKRTLHQTTFSDSKIEFRNVEMSKSAFDKMLKTPPQYPEAKIVKDKQWFKYDVKGDGYLDYANANIYGGAWRDWYGTVQEERMMLEFPAMALLGYLQNGEVHVTKTGRQNSDPTPFIIENICREFELDPSTYGGNTHTAKNIESTVKDVKNPVPVHIIGIAAKDYRGKKGGLYTREDFDYHFKALCLSMIGLKQINPNHPTLHGGAWGCGAFLNSHKTMVYLQVLAAKTTGVAIQLHGAGKDFDLKMVKEVETLVDSMIKENQSVDDILNSVLEMQKKDPSWQYRPDPRISSD